MSSTVGTGYAVWTGIGAVGTALVLGGVFIFTRKEKPKVKLLEEQTA